ncbi:MAG: calcium-binding protein [Gallionella sp.]|nr:calcium-binding protein [Gallionella sp.]
MIENNSQPSYPFPDGSEVLDGESVDIYLFNPGSGQDIIDDTACVDILRIGAGVLPADIIFARNGMDVVLCINGTDDQLTLQNWGRSRSARIECIEFADGTVWHTAYLQLQITAAITGTAGDDSQTV